jgi:hypothetical protein
MVPATAPIELKPTRTIAPTATAATRFLRMFMLRETPKK